MPVDKGELPPHCQRDYKSGDGLAVGGPGLRIPIMPRRHVTRLGNSSRRHGLRDMRDLNDGLQKLRWLSVACRAKDASSMMKMSRMQEGGKASERRGHRQPHCESAHATSSIEAQWELHPRETSVPLRNVLTQEEQQHNDTKVLSQLAGRSGIWLPGSEASK